MNNTLNILGLIAGIGLISGACNLFLWYRDREHRNQKTLGYGFFVVGLVLVLCRILGL